MNFFHSANSPALLQSFIISLMNEMKVERERESII
jgi:hypothetical protein